MRKQLLKIMGIALLLSACGEQMENQKFTVDDARKALDFAATQYTHKMAALPDTLEPRTFQGDTMVYSGIYWWTSGFYPGSLWYLYEYTGDEKFRNEAHKRTMHLVPIKNVTTDHDVGFQLYCSFGNGLRLTGNEEYIDIMLTGARSLATRYNPAIKSLKSWDWATRWQFPVIIDNMMNLELLMWAARESGDDSFQTISVEHAYTSLINHYRDDFSCYHVVDFDPQTGEALQRNTHQGYADWSAWARGQSWGLYGFVMMYRETGNTDFLEHSINIANFLLEHPTLPEDKIPYWDFDAPEIPDTYRDVSSASIMASALLELSTFTDEPEAGKYFSAAETMLASLSSDKYLAGEGENGNFILKHSVGNLNRNSEVDVPLTYADYYFIEALLRYIELKQ